MSSATYTDCFHRLHEAVHAFPNAMDASKLHGFLTGVALGPREIREKPWLEIVLGLPQNTPIDALPGNIKRLAAEVVDEIVGDLLDDCFEPRVDSEIFQGISLPRTDLWCQGFIESVRLVEQAWEARTDANVAMGKMLLLLNMVADPPRFTDLLFADDINPTDVDFLAEVRVLAGPTIMKMADYVLNAGDDDEEDGDDWESDDLEPYRDGLPCIEPSVLSRMTPDDLMALIVGMGEVLPREVVDVCAQRRGAEMLPRLAAYVADTQHWAAEVPEEVWWGLLHCINILGAMDSAEAVAPLLKVFDKIEEYPESELWDWLNGYWPALLRNKREAAAPGLRLIANDKSRADYVRVEAIECLLEAEAVKGESFLDKALDGVAAMAVDRAEDEEMAYQAALLLLDFPRERHRSLLESFVQRQKLTLGGIVYFGMDDIETAFDSGDKRDWEQFDNPWEIYDPEVIAERWSDQDALLFDSERAGEASLSGRQPGKAARNDPCPCGSGRTYKKCCLH